MTTTSKNSVVLLEGQRAPDGKFLVGHAPLSNGRPIGSKTKLGEAFFAALLDDFNRHGMAAIEKVRKDNPGSYLRSLVLLFRPLARDLYLANNRGDEFDDMETVEDVMRKLATEAPDVLAELLRWKEAKPQQLARSKR
jgi:hypothetical protein